VQGTSVVELVNADRWRPHHRGSRSTDRSSRVPRSRRQVWVSGESVLAQILSVVLLPDTGAEGAVKVAESIRQALAVIYVAAIPDHAGDVHVLYAAPTDAAQPAEAPLLG
jgi:hypothetical protein